MFSPANETQFTLTIQGLKHDLRVLKFHGQETISTPFAITVELVSERSNLDLERVLHQQAFLAFNRHGNGIHGQIYRIEQGE